MRMGREWSGVVVAGGDDGRVDWEEWDRRY